MPPPSSQTGATHFPNPNEWTHNCLEMSHRYWKYTLKLIKNDYVQCRARKTLRSTRKTQVLQGIYLFTLYLCDDDFEYFLQELNTGTAYEI